MNWKIKCAASFMISKLPQSMGVYNSIQKHITGRWQRNVKGTMVSDNEYTFHLDAFRKYWGDFSESQYFEFGVARDLFSNLINYCNGMNRQLAIDLHPLATAELINDSCRQLCDTESSYIKRKPHDKLGADFRKDLVRYYGITYEAPLDARHVSMASGSVDLIASTSTFEHVPEEMIREILAESYRLCHDGSIISHQIDYSDHYSHTDNTISPYNFLQFSDKTWKKIYMRHYYQNRLRHNDIRRLIEEAGFRILEEKTIIPENAEDMISRISLDQKFKNISRPDLLTTKGFFVAIK